MKEHTNAVYMEQSMWILDQRVVHEEVYCTTKSNYFRQSGKLVVIVVSWTPPGVLGDIVECFQV